MRELKHPRRFLLPLLQSVVLSLLGAIAHAQEQAPFNQAQFFQSLTPTEKKLPRDVLIQRRLTAGKSVPPGWQVAAQARSSGGGAIVDTHLFKVVGASAEALALVMQQVGVDTFTPSASRPYVTARLTVEQVEVLAAFSSVTRISYVKSAIPQGFTEAITAHRIDGIDEENEPANIPNKPALNGGATSQAGPVVIGIISAQVSEDDLNALASVRWSADAGDCVIPDKSPLADNFPATYPASACTAGGQLFLLDGLSDSFGALPNVVLPSGSPETGRMDVLNMLQAAFDVAPEAHFVLASPGANAANDMVRVIEKLRQGDGTEGASGYIPPVDIIVDDLDFVSENPFRLGEISEAVSDALENGDLYITSAGDGGFHDNDNTLSHSNVYVSDFNGQPNDEQGVLANTLGSTIHEFESGDPFITLTSPLSDICLFWNEDPDDTQTTDKPFVWIIDGGSVDWFNPDQDVGCYSEEVNPSVPPTFAVGTQIIIEDFPAVLTDRRLMLVGVRDDTVAPGAVTFPATFDLTTAGSIRGHAYSKNALTVGSVPFAETTDEPPVVRAFDDLTPEEIGDVSIFDYSADGESATELRFFWRLDTTLGEYAEAVPGEQTASKPDLVAVAGISVKDTLADTVTYHGSSASAAVAAGTAALYWQFRNWQVEQPDSLIAAVVPEDVSQAMKAAVIDAGTPEWDAKFGMGILDAPKVMESALPATNFTLSNASPGVIEVNFASAFNDLSGLFTYALSCVPTTAIPSIDPFELLFPSDYDQGTTGFGGDTAPVLYNVDPDTALECTVVSQRAGFDGSGEVSASLVVADLTPPQVSMTPKAAGVLLTFVASADASSTTVKHTASCEQGGSVLSVSGLDGVTDLPPGDYEVPALPGSPVTCDVVATVERNGGADDITKTVQASATPQQPDDPVVTVTPDSGGVSVSWVIDPDLPAVTSVFLDCSQDGVALTDPEAAVTGTGTFIETEVITPVECTVTTEVPVGGQVVDQTSAPSVATPEEALGGGIPTWLLYAAIQPQIVLEVEHSYGMSSAQTVSEQVDADESAAQTFTTAITGELVSDSIYLNNSVLAGDDASADDLTVEIRSVSTGTPSATEVLASEVVAASQVAGNEENPGEVTVAFATPANLVAGESYAIVVRSTDAEGYQLWSSDASSIYDGGSGFTSDDGSGSNWSAPQAYDFSFETIMRYAQ